MNLPPELLDEIIGQIPQDDEQSLRNCSLVAKSWMYPSRRRIFEAVDVWKARRLKLWMDVIPPTNLGVLQHIRSIRCQINSPPDSPRLSADLLLDHSPSFHHLERLTLFSGFLPPPTQIGTCSAFQHTLLYLCLRLCNVTASALVTFVNYFPNLAHLDLVELYRSVDAQPTPPFSRPLKKLSVTEFTDLGLIDQLIELHPQCDEVSVDMYWAASPPLAQHVINGVGTSVKRLTIVCEPEGVSNVSKIL